MNHEDARALIEAQTRGETLSAAQAEALRQHLRTSPESRAYYDRCAALESALEGGAHPSRALRDRLLARGAPEPMASARVYRWPVAVGAVLAAAAAVLLFTLRRPPEPPDFGVRGAQPAPRAWITIYRPEGDGADDRIVPLDGPLTRGAPLLFAYSNSTEARHLMVVGLDAKGRAHWYHPAYEAEDQDPVSVTIETGVAERRLAERIYVEPALGRMRLCAVFTVEPRRVRTVDAELERTGAWPEGARLDCHDVEVQP